MNSARLSSILNGLTGTASKVYEAVPISEQWSTQKIVAELLRSGRQMAHNEVQGCLNSLEQSGVIRRISAGGRGGPSDTWQRIAIHEKAIPAERQRFTLVDTPPAEPGTKTIDGAITTLASFAQVLRSKARDLTVLADSIDEALLDAQAIHEANTDRYAKLEQFRALLKGL